MSRYRKPTNRPPEPESPLDKEDVFVAKTLEVSHWAQRNRGKVTLAVVVLGLGIVTSVYYVRYRASLESSAAAQLEVLNARAVSGDPADLRSDLELYVERFAGTRVVDEARISLAQVNVELGEMAAAAEALRPLARRIEEPLGSQAAAMLAAITEDLGDLRVAEELYRRLADEALLDFQVREALANAARLRRAQGDDSGAMELYDRMLSRMADDDPDRGVVEMRRAEVAAATR